MGGWILLWMVGSCCGWVDLDMEGIWIFLWVGISWGESCCECVDLAVGRYDLDVGVWILLQWVDLAVDWWIWP